MTAYHDRLTNGTYTPPPTADQLEEATVADLKAELAARDLPTSGTKAELIERLATPQTEDSE
jgi:3-methyladenine DNA glycosylase/8-oxoguanine DNA glycosylase